MTEPLHHRHDAGDGDEGAVAAVSGLGTFSSLERGSSTKLARTRLVRRERMCDLHAATTSRMERRTVDDDDEDAIITRKSHSSRRTRTRPQTGSSSSSTMHERERDESTAVAASERQRCISNGSWLHNAGSVSSRFSSSTFVSFHDNLDWPIFILVLTLVFTVSDACSTRPSPKPRPPRPIWTPDLGPNVVKENCTDDYAELYCMNGGKCYRQKILETFFVNCECLPGFVGPRCQYRDVPDKHMPVQQRIETASIAGGVTVFIIIVVVFSILAWFYFKRRRVSNGSSVGHV